MASKKEIEDLGAPWLAMGEAAAPDRYSVPLDTDQKNLTPPSIDDAPRPQMFTLEGYGGSFDRMKRMDPYDWAIRFGHRRSF